MSRVTQGVKLINLRDGQKVSSISVVDSEKDEEISEPVDRDTSVSDDINSSDDELGNK